MLFLRVGGREPAIAGEVAAPEKTMSPAPSVWSASWACPSGATYVSPAESGEAGTRAESEQMERSRQHHGFDSFQRIR